MSPWPPRCMMKTKTQARWRIYLIAWLSLSAVAAACTRLSPFHSSLPAQQANTLRTPANPTLTGLSPPATSHLTPEAPNAPWGDHCRQRPEGLDAAFVSFKHSPEGLSFAAASPFCATWRVNNTGTQPWPPGTMLVHIGGARLSAPARVPVSSVAPDGMVDITLQLTAPPEEGHYTTYWQLVTPDGCPFGDVLYASFFVEAAQDTPQPTASSAFPTATATPREATPTFEIPDFSAPGACPSPEARFEPVVQQAESLGLELGCVSSETEITKARLQSFWRLLDEKNSDSALHSLIILREDASRLIYVLEGWDADMREVTPRTYEDTWEETEPEMPPACAPLVPPSGFISPKRNIAKVWCEHSLWNSVGWPREAEIPVALTVQPMTQGLLIEALASDGTSWTIAIDSVQRSATVRYVAP